MTDRTDVDHRSLANAPSFTCCICHRSYYGHGHNAQPIAASPIDRACNDCNAYYVFNARIGNTVPLQSLA